MSLKLSQKLGLVEKGLEGVRLAGLDQNPFGWRDLLSGASEDCAKLEEELKDALEPRRAEEAMQALVVCLGFVQNASDCPVTISQDDATNTFHVRVGRADRNNNQYWGDSLTEALLKAGEGERGRDE